MDKHNTVQKYTYYMIKAGR